MMAEPAQYATPSLPGQAARQSPASFPHDDEGAAYHPRGMERSPAPSSPSSSPRPNAWWLDLAAACALLVAVALPISLTGGTEGAGASMALSTDERLAGPGGVRRPLPERRQGGTHRSSAAASPRPLTPDPLATPEPSGPPTSGGAADLPLAGRPSGAAAATGTGELGVVSGSTRPSDEAPVLTYIVEVERGLPVDAEAFAAQVDEVLASERSWGPIDDIAFQRVDLGTPAFRVTLASSDTTDTLCAPLATNGTYSCYMRERAVLNFDRWAQGAEAYGDDLDSYRIYMINHEVGHALGHDHALCPGAGRPAPVMMQQTKGVAPCKPNPWPRR
jgi:Protein of unknown function (DUF3152)